MGDITFEIAGVKLGLRETKVKDKDHTWHVFAVDPAKTGRAARYGEPITALATELPKSVKVDGVDVYLKPDATKDGRKRVVFSGLQTLPTLDEVKQVHVSISESKDGKGWNVVAKVNRPGGGGGTSEATRQANLDALKALFS